MKNLQYHYETFEPGGDAPTDPRLDALLDKALAPHQPPADLNRRIIDLTAPLLVRQTGVIGRIGRAPAVRALAATVVLAASAGIVLTTASIFRQAHLVVSVSQELPQALAQVHTPSVLPDNVSGSAAIAQLDPAGLWSDLQAAEHSLESALAELERDFKG